MNLTGVVPTKLDGSSKGGMAFAIAPALGVPILSGQALAVNALVQRYSGHPLALKLVVETVQELFGGGIDDFLQEEAPVFDDIRHMLDEQFAHVDHHRSKQAKYHRHC